VALYGDALINNRVERRGWLASGRRRSRDRAGVPIRLPGAGGDGGLDHHPRADVVAVAVADKQYAGAAAADNHADADHP